MASKLVSGICMPQAYGRWPKRQATSRGGPACRAPEGADAERCPQVVTQRLWRGTELHERYPHATHLLIEADSGGSNSARSRVWTHQLQVQVADGLGLTVTVCHYPTGASKWNPIEHRLFSEISKTWAGCPLRSFALVAHYIATTATQTGLVVQAHLVPPTYVTGVTVTAAEMARLNLELHRSSLRKPARLRVGGMRLVRPLSLVGVRLRAACSGVGHHVRVRYCPCAKAQFGAMHPWTRFAARFQLSLAGSAEESFGR